jgi:hypothetical protein
MRMMLAIGAMSRMKLLFKMMAGINLVHVPYRSQGNCRG